MRRLLNTLYVVTEDAYVRKDGANVVIDAKGGERGRVPVHLLGSVVCIGRVSVSPVLMGYLAESGVSLVHLTEHGRFLARLEGPQSGNILLRRAQHAATLNEARAAPIAGAIVAAKAMNQRAVLRRCLRDYGGELSEDHRRALSEADFRLSAAANSAVATTDVDAIRGHEGDAAAAYFSVFPLLIRRPEEAFEFRGRTRRPPRDAPNALLSFLYVLVAHDCRSALETVGLDPQMGFLHADRPGRQSLALDLAEELRAPLADRTALTLINRKQLDPDDFETREQGGVYLRDDPRKRVLAAYQERKKIELRHAFLGENVSLGLVANVQAQLLARHLRGDLDGYPPFIWK